MNRRNLLACFWSSLVGKVFAGNAAISAPPVINPKNLPVIKFKDGADTLDGGIKWHYTTITNEFELFGETPWRKVLWVTDDEGVVRSRSGVVSGETYPWDRPYHDQTWDSHARAVREAVIWLNQEDMMAESIHSYNFFWGEVVCALDYRGYSYYCGTHERASGPTVYTEFRPTQNSHWLRLTPRNREIGYRLPAYRTTD